MERGHRSGALQKRAVCCSIIACRMIADVSMLLLLLLLLPLEVDRFDVSVREVER